LVRGPISVALEATSLETGELTVVINIGHKPEILTSDHITDEQMATELGHITESKKISRRKGIQELARKHGKRPNDVYAAVERARRLVK
jgi:hypothetical protein